jgi:hypothetical protein
MTSWGFVCFGGVAYVAGGKFCAGFVFSQSPLPREIALTVPTLRLLPSHGKSANVLHASYNVMEGTRAYLQLILVEWQDPEGIQDR